MLYIHKGTGEIVELVGIYNKPNGTRMAHCLCDSRLHFGNRREVANGTVAYDYSLESLVPVAPPNWDEIRDSYPEGTWDSIIERKKKALEDSLRSQAMAAFKKTYDDLRNDGVPEDLALFKAEEAKNAFIKERLAQKPIPFSGRTPYCW